MRVGHLFAGIDGFGLGLSDAGLETAWTIELGDFAHGILAQRLPAAEHFRDVRDVTGPPRVEVLAGGFPCQDVSGIGQGPGMTGARSGLWSEYARLIADVQPELVLIENVPMLLRRGMEIVIGDLVDLGYCVEWDCLPAAAFGAPHLRDRVWIVASRSPDPRTFGAPSSFPMRWRDLPPIPSLPWARWPRAGFVNGEDLTELEPIATIGAIRAAQGAADFPTPVARDWKGTGLEGQLGTVAARGLWPTPRASAGKSVSGGGEGGTYRRTPSQRKGTHGLYLQTEVIEAELDAGRITEDDVESYRRESGALNPAWVEWLMGFPLGWTDPAVDNAELRRCSWDDGEPDGVPRTLNGIPADLRRHRLTALGNALVPPAAAWLARRILDQPDQQAAA